MAQPARTETGPESCIKKKQGLGSFPGLALLQGYEVGARALRGSVPPDQRNAAMKSFHHRDTEAQRDLLSLQRPSSLKDFPGYSVSLCLCVSVSLWW
jgi:hypothetical protein